MRANSSDEQEIRHRIHRKEVILLVIIFIVIAIVAAVFYGRQQDAGDMVVVTVNNEEYGRYPLDQDQEVLIRVDEEHSNRLIIKDGQADVTEATCPDHLCVNMKSISMEGESIVCLPNRVIVEIDSNTSHTNLDTMAQ